MSSDDPVRIELLLERIRTIHPNLNLEQVTPLKGQFNDALILNDELVFRFPRSPHAAAMLANETTVLRTIRPHLMMPIPEPEFGDLDGDEPFVGYRLIPGEPLRRETLAGISDHGVLQQIADQLASFLRELHSVPVEQLDPGIPNRDSYEHWSELYRDVREQLFRFMRTTAREEVSQHFESYLSDPACLSFTTVVRHGDFGAGNILWNPRTHEITGVIDFSFAGLGDPAIDAAAISTFGEPFLERMFNVYPGLTGMLDRVRFYRGTYALTEALDGLRDGDGEHFESGISGFR